MSGESKKEEFRKYLERSGVIDALTKVLVALYEEPEKPANALDFIKQYLGAPTSGDVETMKAEKDELVKKNEELTKNLEVLPTRPADTPCVCCVACARCEGADSCCVCARFEFGTWAPMARVNTSRCRGIRCMGSGVGKVCRSQHPQACMQMVPLSRCPSLRRLPDPSPLFCRRCGVNSRSCRQVKAAASNGIC